MKQTAAQRDLYPPVEGVGWGWGNGGRERDVDAPAEDFAKRR